MDQQTKQDLERILVDYLELNKDEIKRMMREEKKYGIELSSLKRGYEKYHNNACQLLHKLTTEGTL